VSYTRIALNRRKVAAPPMKRAVFHVHLRPILSTFRYSAKAIFQRRWSAGFGSTTMLAARAGLHHVQGSLAAWNDDLKLDDSTMLEAVRSRYPSLRTACGLVFIREFDSLEAT
jgi:hypothetical protein